MISTSALRIELHRGSTVTPIDLQDDRVLIGSGSHCDVRLAPDEAAVEQLLVEILGDDVYVRTRSIEHSCLLNGAPFFEGRVSASSMLEFGGVGIRILSIERDDGKAKEKSARASSTSPTMQLLGVIAVGLGLYAALHAPPRNGSQQLSLMARPAQSALAPVACPQAELGAARALAQQLEIEAASKRERAPFHPRDGLDAAPLFERAAGCYRTAGEVQHANAMHEAALELRAQTAQHMHLAHVRVERSLTEGDYAAARRNAELALLLTSDPTEPYAQWLLAVKRDGLLRARTGAKR
jgi:hypothetical protein